MDKETIETIRTLLEPLQIELMNIKNQISNLDNRVANLEYETRKGIRELKQNDETIMTILEGRNLLPKAQ
ncbi:MAG: hypothetical protein SPJ50_02200 [Ligilactobacillus salivarius]|uniref:Uncharacterized protein n=1 Tax=Clostridium porci TaxID=2605778 RepID=A0A7X2NPS9_9CLOT|nr:hypothetical protein [Clostridium porci]MDY5246412.1 hypothetical protein [Ligilactobacillus salivarius]MSS38744.1 hypothetical protein [Clostridium porci]